jgi:hypothetical protein
MKASIDPGSCLSGMTWDVMLERSDSIYLVSKSLGCKKEIKALITPSTYPLVLVI